ncbi:MAG: iron-containing alcohol dehydrogenase [Sandaracinaceae bacterium]|nr:iron-containing alcohol dehydrogenase [Sandaracinaceae bacterium]
MTAVWSFPTRIVFGEGSVNEAGPEARKLGATQALVVTDAGVRGAGLADEVVRALEKAGVHCTIFDAITTNPAESEVLAATAAFKTSKSDIVVGIGGGAPMDVAKLVRLCATHPMPLDQYDDAIGGDAKVTEPVPPMIAVPTTAGTGSEVGRSGVVTLASTHKKTIIFAPRLVPSVAILDPVLTVSMPARITAATGFDALTHNVEAYCAKGDHPMADAIALEGIELCARHLAAAVEDGKNLEARGAMMKAAMMGAVAFQKGLGACHALAHPLGAELGMHHGLANALCLPAVLDFNRTAITMRVARIARILGVKGNDLETLAFECAGKVRALRKQLGLPNGLAEAGVTEEQIVQLAPLAFADATHQSNPRTCTKDDMLALYRASM